MNLECYGKKVELQRNGKKPEIYTLILEVTAKSYLATKDNGRNPKQVYLVHPKKSEFI